jgi:hypothetical protein
MTFMTVKCWTKRAMRESDEKNTNEISSRLRNRSDIPFSNVGFATLSEDRRMERKVRRLPENARADSEKPLVVGS